MDNGFFSPMTIVYLTQVVVKLEAKAADLYLVNRYLEEIAKSYNVNWALDTESDSLITVCNVFSFQYNPIISVYTLANKTDLSIIM